MNRLFLMLLALLIFVPNSSELEARAQRSSDDSKIKLDATREAKRDSALFPSAQSIDGVDYDRLRGKCLVEAITGTSILPTIPSGAVGHQSFEFDGRYGLSGDFAWEAWGGYFVTNDLVTTWINDADTRGSSLQKFALYRSQSQRYVLAWLGRRQEPVFAEIKISKKER